MKAKKSTERNGKRFFGAWLPVALIDQLRFRAHMEHRSMTQQAEMFLSRALNKVWIADHHKPRTK